MSKVGIIVLNFKLKDKTLQCLKSIQNLKYPQKTIYIVDNNSQDGLADALPEDPMISFIQTGSNLGFAGGNNVGIKRALQEGCDYIFVLNPDTTLEKNALDHLIAAAREKGDGVFGPKILFGDKKTIWYAGGIFDRANVLGSHRGVDQLDKGQFEKQEPTDFVSGAAMLVSGGIFKKIGYFDEDYFMYYEDADFCFRAQQKGFDLYYVPEAVVYHENAQSSGLGSSLQDYFITRNRMLLASKFLTFRTRFALLREALRNMKSPVRRLALQDFLMGKLGKGSFIDD